jgi:hypothetical protein
MHNDNPLGNPMGMEISRLLLMAEPHTNHSTSLPSSLPNEATRQDSQSTTYNLAT